MQNTLTLIDHTGKTIPAQLIAEEKPITFIELQSDIYNSGQIICKRLYDGFQELHQQLDAKQMKLLCMGFRYDVRPSGMALSMGHGTLAYKFRLGEPAFEQVSIFDQTSDVEAVVGYDEQQLFFRKWVDSLRS
jgi:hypothetical protein